jgi:hypothetical protein
MLTRQQLELGIFLESFDCDMAKYLSRHRPTGLDDEELVM